MSNQLKAGASEELIKKADVAKELHDEYNSRADFLRAAAEKHADEIINDNPDENTDPNEITTTNTDNEPEPEDKDDPDCLDYLWTKYGLEKGEKENLQTLTEDALPEKDIDEYDLADTDVVSGRYEYRLAALRGMMLQTAFPKSVPRKMVMRWLDEEFDMSKPIQYKDLKRMAEYGAGYPTLEADPRWSDEELRQKLLDFRTAQKHTIGRSKEDIREKESEKNQEITDLLDTKLQHENGESELVYRKGKLVFFEREDYEEWMDDYVDTVEDVVEKADGRMRKGMWTIMLNEVLEYLMEVGVREDWARARQKQLLEGVSGAVEEVVEA